MQPHSLPLQALRQRRVGPIIEPIMPEPGIQLRPLRQVRQDREDASVSEVFA